MSLVVHIRPKTLDQNMNFGLHYISKSLHIINVRVPLKNVMTMKSIESRKRETVPEKEVGASSQLNRWENVKSEFKDIPRKLSEYRHVKLLVHEYSFSILNFHFLSQLIWVCHQLCF